MNREESVQHFLDLIKKSRRGKFKIYIGMIAGVGKSYRMLQEAHELLDNGVDVQIGYIETHGRAGTEVLLPRFTCEVVFEPFVRTGIGFSLYDVDDNLELTELPYLKGNQYLLYTNYFGIKTQYVNRLSAIYNTRLIIDNA